VDLGEGGRGEGGGGGALPSFDLTADLRSASERTVPATPTLTRTETPRFSWIETSSSNIRDPNYSPRGGGESLSAAAMMKSPNTQLVLKAVLLDFVSCSGIIRPYNANRDY